MQNFELGFCFGQIDKSSLFAEALLSQIYKMLQIQSLSTDTSLKAGEPNLQCVLTSVLGNFSTVQNFV